MLDHLKKTIGKTHLLAIILASVFLTSALLSLNMSMQHDDMQGMSCSLGMGDSSCLMDPGQHLSWWNHTFAAAMASQAGLQLIALISLCLFLGIIILPKWDLAKQVKQTSHTAKDPPPEARLFNYIVQFFAKGKVQPTLYA